MKRILVVDDDARILEFMRELLLEAGFRVDTADSSRRAWLLLAAGAVDLVVTDILMPDADGTDLILRLRARPARPRILAVSGGGMIPSVDYLVNAGLLGADAVLSKPFTGQQLVEEVRRLLAGAGAPAPPAAP